MTRRQAQLLPVLTVALLLAACAKTGPSPEEQARMMELMRVIYGPAEGDHVIATLRNQENPLREESYRLKPISMHELGANRVALVANGILEENQNPDRGTPGSMSVYLLNNRDGKWAVERRFENKASIGSYGQLGDVAWLELGEGKPGIGIDHSYASEGINVRQITLFDLAAPLMNPMSIYMHSIASDNDKACNAALPQCWNIQGKWRFERKEKQAYDDLVIDYTGYVETRPDRAPELAPRERSEVKSTVRYTYRRGEYFLVSGELPSVPGL